MVGKEKEKEIPSPLLMPSAITIQHLQNTLGSYDSTIFDEMHRTHQNWQTQKEKEKLMHLLQKIKKTQKKEE